MAEIIHASRQSVTQQEIENPLLCGAFKLPEFKERVVTGWRRFSSGLWRIPEGDICAASSGKTFVEGGQLYTTMGMLFLGKGVEAHCHPLLPMGSVEVPTKPYSSEEKLENLEAKRGRLARKSRSFQRIKANAKKAKLLGRWLDVPLITGVHQGYFKIGTNSSRPETADSQSASRELDKN